MTLLIDLSVIAIILFCVWRGYKNGLVRGVFGIVALIAALIIANVVAEAYSEEFTGAIKPFIGGIVDSTLSDVVEENTAFDFGYLDGLDLNDPDIDLMDFGAAFTTLREIGLPEASASHVAELAARSMEERPVRFLAEAITNRLSSTLAFIAVFGIAFLLLAIISAVIGNLFSFVFSLPGLKLVDTIAGIIFGLAKGLLIVFVISAVIRYFGLFVQATVESTTVLMYFINNNPVANIIGI